MMMMLLLLECVNSRLRRWKSGLLPVACQSLSSRLVRRVVAGAGAEIPPNSDITEFFFPLLMLLLLLLLLLLFGPPFSPRVVLLRPLPFRFFFGENFMSSTGWFSSSSSSSSIFLWRPTLVLLSFSIHFFLAFTWITLFRVPWNVVKKKRIVGTRGLLLFFFFYETISELERLWDRWDFARAFLFSFPSHFLLLLGGSRLRGRKREREREREMEEIKEPHHLKTRKDRGKWKGEEPRIKRRRWIKRRRRRRRRRRRPPAMVFLFSCFPFFFHFREKKKKRSVSPSLFFVGSRFGRPPSPGAAELI